NTQSPLLPFSPLSLPELLTGETAAIASGVTVNADGSITLTGSDVALPTEAGSAIASGTLDTSSEQGGNVTVLGETVGLLSATLDASGNTGGGTIRVGGDYKGEGPLPTAAVTFMDEASTLVADAVANGDGGRIILWSDETTRSYGSISAQGGSDGGDGGFVETSSHGFLDVQGIPNVGAPNGQGGLWLLDPASIELVDAPETSDNIAIDGGVFSPQEPATPSTLDLNLVNGALDSGDVTIETDASDIVGESDGSILLVDAFTFTSGDGNTLFINAATDILANEGASLSSEVPGLNFNFQAVGQINLTGLTTQAGNITLEGAAISTSEVLFSNGGSVNLTGSSGSINVAGVDTSVAEVDTGGGAIAIATPGIVQVGEALISAGGDIAVQGTSDGVAPGVNVDGAIASGGGGITITGNSIAESTAAAVSIVGAVTSEGGDVTVTGNDGAVDVTSINAAGIDAAGGAIAVTTQGAGTEGTPTISATGPITTAEAGTITLTSDNGGIDIQNAEADAGAISLIASGFVQVATDLITQGGSIAVQGNSEGAPSDISVTNSILSNGGDITLQSPDGRIAVGQVDATGEVIGGNVEITSEAPDTAEVPTITATEVVTSEAGNIALNSPGGSIQIERAASGSGVLSLIASGFIGVAEDLTTQGGDITVQGNDDGGLSEISVAAPITSNGGSIAVTSDDGAIAVDQVDAGGGNIQITTQGTDTLEAAAVSSTGTIATADAGTIDLTSNGGINVQGIAAGSGPISAIANGLIQVAEALNTQGGSISLQSAGTNNTTPAIAVTAPIFSNGGEVTLNSTAGDIEVADVNAGTTTPETTEGNVDITSPNFVRSTGSILTTDGAPITITHGGDGNTPFTVGDSTTNGTTGSIANGTDTVPFQAFLDTVSFGDISIITNAPDVTPPDIPDEVDQDEFECFGDCEDFENDFEGDDFTDDGFQEDFDLDVDLNDDISDGGDPDNGGGDNDRPDGGDPYGDVDDGDIDNGLDDDGFDRDNGDGFDDRDYQGDVEEIAYDDWEGGDGLYADDFVAYFDLPEIAEPSFEESQDTLRSLTAQVGSPPALMYTRFVPAGSTNVAQKSSDKTTQVAAQPDDVLELVLVTPDGQPKRVVVSGATREQVIRSVRQLQIELTDRTRRRRTAYLSHAQQLYKWLVAPMEEVLQQEDIAHVSFIMAPGLRSLPLAALHDGEGFIIEKYTVGLMPSLALTDSRYTDIRQAPVLAMGASEFTNLPDLPAVPFELDTIVNQLRPGEKQLNEAFTPQTLVTQRQSESYPILHLATHGEFRPGGPGNSFIQFWDQRLGLDQVRQLQLDSPTLELLVMSACRTALGDSDAELGFAGLAVQ
ncbi:MAG: CHAT domain-containing protein, partial [Cyanobacteria bacterium J06636_16]